MSVVYVKNRSDRPSQRQRGLDLERESIHIVGAIRAAVGVHFLGEPIMLCYDQLRLKRPLAMALLWLGLCFSWYFYPPVEHVAAQSPPGDTAPADTEAARGKELNLFLLFWQSRWWMVPITALSFVVVAVSVERWIQLRKSRVIPEELIRQLSRMGNSSQGFDPREAYRLCQAYPSAASRVIRAMLLKVGRPHSEVEHAVKEASDREAQKLYSNVRWLNLATAVAPLFGLMGTVWGMIRAFHDTTQLLPGQNKAEYLAEGIYLALVTTLAGLAVAIPAAILSHFFESRIIALFHQIDELLFNLLPQIEKYEGRVRFSQYLPEDSSNGNKQQRTVVASPPGAPSV